MDQIDTIFDRFADDLACSAALEKNEITINLTPAPGMTASDFLCLQLSMVRRHPDIALNSSPDMKGFCSRD